MQSDVFYLDSALLQNVSSTEFSDWSRSNDVSGWNLNIPSAKSLSLRSKHFTGTLDINNANNFANLSNIDISGSKLSLSLNGEYIKTIRNINLNNISSDSIYIINTDNIERVSKYNIKANSFTFTP